MDVIANIIGLVGAGAVLVAYFLLASGRLASDAPLYPALNALGSVCVLVSLGWHWNLPSAVINGCWVLISAVALVRIFRRRGRA